MGYILRDHLSFCLIGNRSIFLDLRNDRYFCLGASLEAAFQRIVSEGQAARSDLAAVERLLATGILRIVDADDRPIACPSPKAPSGSLVDEAEMQPSHGQLARAIASLARTAVALKSRTLHAIAKDLRRSRASAAPRRGHDRSELVPIAAAYERLALFTSSHDQCLWRSVSIARHLTREGYEPDLVFGVRPLPFKAHCWVQHEGLLVSDRMDAVRPFTPILVVSCGRDTSL